MTENNKQPLTSADMTETLLAQLRVASPQIFSEGRVDFAKLQMVLCLDTTFDGNDVLKTNTVLKAQTHGIIFKTV